VRGKLQPDTLLDIEGEYPVGMQLFGTYPDLLAAAAEMAADRGAALIGIDMGCPADRL